MTAKGSYAYVAYQSAAADPFSVFSIDINKNEVSLGVVPGSSPLNPDMAVDNSGNLYVAYDNGSVVRVYMLTAGVWTQLGGDLTGGTYPSIDIAPDGTPYVAYRDLSGFITVKALK